MLKGVEGSETNPPRLKMEYIVLFVREIPNARLSFNDLYPLLLPEEQTRLLPVFRTAYYTMPDYLQVEDNFQHRINTQSVRTVGKYGGTRLGK